MALYGFCHGWMLDKGFGEVTCKRRESCAYYDEMFYRQHGDHLEDFDELFPMEPCQFFIEREGTRPNPSDWKTDFFDFMRE